MLKSIVPDAHGAKSRNIRKKIEDVYWGMGAIAREAVA